MIRTHTPKPLTHLSAALVAIAVAACSTTSEPVSAAGPSSCEPVSCEADLALCGEVDDGCEGTVQCAPCREMSDTDCKAKIPASRTLSQPCCAGWGRDACGALLFCAALDGRNQPTCYPERSRADGTECPSDMACASGSCNLDTKKCRSSPGGACTNAIGCAPSPTGVKTFCDTSTGPPVCRAVGDGNAGALCAEGSDCLSHECTKLRCQAAAGDSCSVPESCPQGLSCHACQACGGKAKACVSECQGIPCVGDKVFSSITQCRESNIWTVCPTATVSQVKCTRVAGMGLSVRVSWTGGSADGYQVVCSSGARGAIGRVPGSGPSGWAEMALGSATSGESFICSVHLLTQTSDSTYGWVVGPPSETCTVVVR
jgi:hypothetical protein